MGAAKRFTQNPGSNAICYYRYSSGAQRDVSIDQQREAAQEYAKAHGYHIIKEYEDHAISGTSDERPQFQQMLYEVDKLRPAYLILWKTDRLSRDRIDAVLAKKRLRECGVKISYVAEAIPAAVGVRLSRVMLSYPVPLSRGLLASAGFSPYPVLAP